MKKNRHTNAESIAAWKFISIKELCSFCGSSFSKKSGYAKKM